MRDSFVFYHSYRDAAKMLSETDRLIFYDAITDYALDGVDPHLLGAVGAVFAIAKQNIDSSAQRYEKAVESGKQGGRPRKWVDREEAEQLYTELKSWDKVADKLGVARETLRKARAVWNAQKPKNLTDNYTDTVTDTVTVTVSDNINNKASDGTRLEAVPPPRGWEWNSKIVANGKNHYRRCINKETGEDKVVQLD